MRFRRAAGWAAGAMLLVGMALASGCAGSGSVYRMPFVRKDFPPREEPAEIVEVREACYWLDERDRVNVALRTGPALSQVEDGGDQWLLSLVLEELPAGSERLYNLGLQSLRQRSSRQGIHRRSMAIMGVATVKALAGGVLDGRFHAVVRQQQFTILTGWHPLMGRAPISVMAGTFQAVHDPDKGKAIRALTEADGMERIFVTPPASAPSRPARASSTRPASMPATDP